MEKQSQQTCCIQYIPDIEHKYNYMYCEYNIYTNHMIA